MCPSLYFQGFQLTRPPLSERGSTLQVPGVGGRHSRDLNSVYVLHEALENLKTAMKKKNSRQRRANDSITVHMGLSHVFQKLVLAFQDISVFIYRQKSVSVLDGMGLPVQSAHSNRDTLK